MSGDLAGWGPRQVPGGRTLEGRYVRLEPLNAASHGDGLFAASTVPDAEERFRFLGDRPPATREAFQPWLDWAAASRDPLFFAVIDKASGRIGGRQTFMRVDAPNGVVEIGNIYWSPLIARRPAATEALFLFAEHVFSELGYRRFEWKCDNANRPSKRAAERFGFTFEGLFRQHMVVKGRNRDTAWYSILNRDWERVRVAYEEWLKPGNFDADGSQKRRLADIRAEVDRKPI